MNDSDWMHVCDPTETDEESVSVVAFASLQNEPVFVFS